MKITVAVDIMGGDKCPCELATGAINAAKEFKSLGLELVIVGTEEAIGQMIDNVRKAKRYTALNAFLTEGM